MTEITQADRDAAEDASYNVEGCMCDLCLPKVARQFARHRETAAAEKRAKIVAWLEKNAKLNPHLPEAIAVVLLFSQAITKEAHLK